MTISAIFFDVGGVLGTNGWDRHDRLAVATAFDLDYDEMEERHDLVSAAFETGHLDLDGYLDAVIFHDERPFSRESFWNAMTARSQPREDALQIAADLKDTGRYFMATLNNESHELNDFRIEHFGLRERFDVFLTSSYLGVKKPDDAIFGLALHITARKPGECVFIDDRELNIKAAVRHGMKTIHYRDVEQLRTGLIEAGVAF